MSNNTKPVPGSLEALAQVVASSVKGVRPLRPVVQESRSRWKTRDSVTRECMLRRIRWLRRHYPVAVLIDQATFNLPGIDALDDDEIVNLLATLEQARECAAEGISFEEAGLIADQRNRLDPSWMT